MISGWEAALPLRLAEPHTHNVKKCSYKMADFVDLIWTALDVMCCGVWPNAMTAQPVSLSFSKDQDNPV